MINIGKLVTRSAWRALLVLALAVILLADCRPSLAWRGRVLLVPDGDTVHVVPEEGGEKVRVRLYGVDAPECAAFSWKAQPYSRKAREFAREILPKGQAVTVLSMYTDKYGREVGCIIVLPDGRVVQEELLRAGLAWVDPRYCGDCGHWELLEEDARRGGRGLWREKQAVPPWEWRKSHREQARRAAAEKKASDPRQDGNAAGAFCHPLPGS